MEEEKSKNPSDQPKDDAETAEKVQKDNSVPEAAEVPKEYSEKDAEETTELNPETTIEQAISQSENQPDNTQTDQEIDEAVDDIVRSESDKVLAEDDAKLAAAAEDSKKQTLKDKLGHWLSVWWNTPLLRNGTFVFLGVLFVLITLLPPARYGALNLFGVRVSSSMAVVDSQTRLPLKNINVQLQDQTAVTNEQGEVVFSGLKLGSSELTITKRGYADNVQQITLGWGSNPIGDQSLIATGEQFRFVLRDWQSDQAIVEAEAVSGENSAIADDQGVITLTVGEEDIANVEVEITAEGYRSETLSNELLNSEEIIVSMVPGKKHAFVSNRDGQYDLYSIDVDGQNENLVLGATGEEREVPAVITHPSRDIIAFVSSRDGERNKDGFALDGLFIVDVTNSETKRVARSEQMQVIGWSGDNLVYWQVVEGTSASNPQRSKLISYNERTGERTEIAVGNYFNDVELVNNRLYYAISSFAVPQSFAKLYAADIGGSDNAKIVDSQVWNIFRTGYDTLVFSAENQKWYQEVGRNQPEEIPQQGSPTTRRFVDSPNGERTAWVETRDGKGVLLISATSQIVEDQILSLPGLDQVLYWSNDDTLVFRVISNSETADYVINLSAGGEPLKVTDVTATRNVYF